MPLTPTNNDKDDPGTRVNPDGVTLHHEFFSAYSGCLKQLTKAGSSVPNAPTVAKSTWLRLRKGGRVSVTLFIDIADAIAFRLAHKLQSAITYGMLADPPTVLGIAICQQRAGRRHIDQVDTLPLINAPWYANANEPDRFSGTPESKIRLRFFFDVDAGAIRKPRVIALLQALANEIGAAGDIEPGDFMRGSLIVEAEMLVDDLPKLLRTFARGVLEPYSLTELRISPSEFHKVKELLAEISRQTGFQEGRKFLGAQAALGALIGSTLPTVGPAFGGLVGAAIGSGIGAVARADGGLPAARLSVTEQSDGSLVLRRDQSSPAVASQE